MLPVLSPAGNLIAFLIYLKKVLVDKFYRKTEKMNQLACESWLNTVNLA